MDQTPVLLDWWDEDWWVLCPCLTLANAESATADNSLLVCARREAAF